MIPKECKRLAEVDFPIAVVSKHSAREKSIRHGHPSTLHLWWARRPLGACRAMLLALLLPDPCDPCCPEEFKQSARNILPRVQGRPGAKDIDLRNELLRFIGDFANWDNSVNSTYLDASSGLVQAAHGKEPPLVVDPFAGGGSIPLEALRLGCETFASDLNPVAWLILNTMLKDIPRHDPGLADEFRKVGAEIKVEMEKELATFYPPDPDDSRPIAYLWARTITCDSCGAEIPLIRSFWLCKKPARLCALRPRVVRAKGRTPEIVLDIFQPKTEREALGGTVTRAKAVCLACSNVLSPDRVRKQLTEQRGGVDAVFNEKQERERGARMLAVVTLRPMEQGRHYRQPTKGDYSAVFKAEQHLKKLLKDWDDNGRIGLSPVPSEGISNNEIRRISVPLYGMSNWGDLFSTRQKLVLCLLSSKIRSRDVPENFRPLLALAFSRCVDHWSGNATWLQGLEAIAHTFVRHAIGIVWDFAESVGFGGGGAAWEGQVDWVARVVEFVNVGIKRGGEVALSDATSSPLPDGSATVWFTDPPYYDAVPYSHLSDYFFVWLKRAIPERCMPRNAADVNTGTTPKEREIVVDRPHHLSNSTKNSNFYEASLARAFGEGRRILREDGIGCVVFAHKTTEGWEALLFGIIQGGWTITGSWPVATERKSRLNARENASLSASVHLVCRPRPENAPVGDWSDVIGELPQRVGDWIERLQREGVRGADLVFACIGPAMEIYSRYASVEDAEGRNIPLGGDPTAIDPYNRGFLAYVWETVGRLALEQVLGTAEAKARNGASGALEEDSRLTALFLWTLQATDTESNAKDADANDDDDDVEEDEEKPKKKKAGLSLIYDVARRFAQPLGIHLDKWEGRIIETEKGVVRLLPVGERAKQLFGEADASAMAHRIEQDVKASRNYTFAFMQDVAAPPEIKPRGRGKAKAGMGTVSEASAPQMVTTLDRLHAAMLLQSSGQSNGLRAMLKEEQQRGPDFLRLANSLSALYPKDSEEKRLLDAMLLAAPR
jgi:putative DNA methylase